MNLDPEDVALLALSLSALVLAGVVVGALVSVLVGPW